MDVGKIAKKLLGPGIFVLALCTSTGAAIAAPVTGAIFTTNVDGSFVNGNVYDYPDDVYLDGGPRPNAPCSAAGLPDGDYYFQVTDPSGSELLSNDDISNRTVTVASGVITKYVGTHTTSIGQCGSITVQLYPYNPTLNPGGEYKVWMTPVGSYTPGAGSYGFIPKYSKTDNFKVLIPCLDGYNYDPETNSCVLVVPPESTPPPVE